MVGYKLTTTCGEDKQHCHTVAKGTKTCQGKASKTADLNVGTQVRVTVKNGDKSVAIAVESGKHIPAASHKA